MTAMRPRIAIVDYSLGNLFSIQRACEYVGMEPLITSSKQEILDANAVLLPGMGAFGDAMESLRRLDLVEVLQDIACSEKWLIGICLGIQLLMSESSEFGTHRGLGIIEGTVEPLVNPRQNGRLLKVPQIGWNHVNPAGSWERSPLEGVREKEYMYFVHTYFPKPDNRGVILSTTSYGGIDFCSSLMVNHIFACLFHPERSGKPGLAIYEKISRLIGQPVK